MIATAAPWWGIGLVALCVFAALIILFVGMAIFAIVAVALIFGRPERPDA